MRYLLNKIKILFSKESGYSLIELMVSIGVFATVVSMASGAFILTLRGHRKTFTSQIVADNVRYVMEVMAKEIRMAKKQAPGSSRFNISSGGGCVDCRIRFDSNMPNRSGAEIRFQLIPISGQIRFRDGIGGFEPLTSSNIKVTELRFVESYANDQERITIVLSAESANVAADAKTSIIVQTTISPREL